MCAINLFLIFALLDCADEIKGIYGESISIYAPTDAQYLEFTKLASKETTVVWNRTDPKVRRSNVQMTWNNIDITGLTHADNGHYNLRKKDNTLLSRKKLKVQGNEVNYNVC